MRTKFLVITAVVMVFCSPIFSGYLYGMEKIEIPSPVVISPGWNQINPVATSSGGIYLVAWIEQNELESRIIATRIAGDGTNLDPWGIIISEGGRHDDICIARDVDGILLIAWQDTQTDLGIRVQVNEDELIPIDETPIRLTVSHKSELIGRLILKERSEFRFGGETYVSESIRHADSDIHTAFAHITSTGALLVYITNRNGTKEINAELLQGEVERIRLGLQTKVSFGPEGKKTEDGTGWGNNDSIFGAEGNHKYKKDIKQDYKGQSTSRGFNGTGKNPLYGGPGGKGKDRNGKGKNGSTTEGSTWGQRTFTNTVMEEQGNGGTLRDWIVSDNWVKITFEAYGFEYVVIKVKGNGDGPDTDSPSGKGPWQDLGFIRLQMKGSTNDFDPYDNTSSPGWIDPPENPANGGSKDRGRYAPQSQHKYTGSAGKPGGGESPDPNAPGGLGGGSIGGINVKGFDWVDPKEELLYRAGKGK